MGGQLVRRKLDTGQFIEFVKQIASEFELVGKVVDPAYVEALAKDLCESATIHNRQMVLDCNYGSSGFRDNYVERIEQDVTEKVAEFGAEPVFTGDPRGYTVKLKLMSGRTNDWGQTGYCVPTD